MLIKSMDRGQSDSWYFEDKLSSVSPILSPRPDRGGIRAAGGKDVGTPLNANITFSSNKIEPTLPWYTMLTPVASSGHSSRI
jgi:hypothetical protein